MTIRELTAMVLLYRACPDAKVQGRVLELVPELAELSGLVVPFWGNLKKGEPPPGDQIGKDER